MPRVYVGIGSNINREVNIRSAVAELRRRFGALRVSTVYESKPIGFEGRRFYNLVVGFDTDEEVHEVARTLRAIEVRHGRMRDTPRFSSRTLDLDLLFYDDLVLNEAHGLELPRREITRYAFVLRPLAELAGGRRHPVDGRSFGELWGNFDKAEQPLRPVTFHW